jgi:hypothetical protein
MRFLFFAFVLCSVSSFGQIGMDQWRIHVPNREAIDVTTDGNLVFAAFDNGLLEYDAAAAETSVWTDVNGLSDVKLSALGRQLSNKKVFVGYANGNIDVIHNNTITNIPAIRLAEIQGNKRINRIVNFDGDVFFATGFGIVRINPSNNEVKESYYPTLQGDAILDVAFIGDTMYALTANRLLKASLSNPAVADPSQWVIDTRLPVLTSNSYTDIEEVGNAMFALLQVDAFGLDTVYQLNYTGNAVVSDINFSLQINSLSSDNSRLIVNADGAIYRYFSDLTIDLVNSSYFIGKWFQPKQSVFSNGGYWIADGKNGLQRLTEYNLLTRVDFNGPPKSDFYAMDWKKNTMIVAGGGMSEKLSTFSSSGVYSFKDEVWDLYDRDNMDLWSGTNIWDFLAVSIEPNNAKKAAVGTFSSYPVSILNFETGVTDTFTPLNSPMEYSGPGSTKSLVTALEYDENGDLWVLNGYSLNPLKLYHATTWYSFDCGGAAKNQFSGNMVIDYNGHKWFALDAAGLFGYNHNNTPVNATDDKVINLNSGDFSGALPSNTVTALAVDFDNEIWIGTDNGFAILYNSDAAFDAGPGDYNAQRVKIPVEGVVEYMLGTTNITDIEVDGGNRKWFGTANSGIILLSADGLEVIKQFTTDNSPLISNNIIDLEIDQKTGELFIITDKGLISYRSDASYEDPEYSDVKVFPNPVRPEYDGLITIQGIRYDSDVKVTDVAGNLVYKTSSNGGTATWNGRTLSGDKVATGVYLIWTSVNEGKGRQVGKVLVVR